LHEDAVSNLAWFEDADLVDGLSARENGGLAIHEAHGCREVVAN
jgi:hypothetical protein